MENEDELKNVIILVNKDKIEHIRTWRNFPSKQQFERARTFTNLFFNNVEYVKQHKEENVYYEIGSTDFSRAKPESSVGKENKYNAAIELASSKYQNRNEKPRLLRQKIHLNGAIFTSFVSRDPITGEPKTVQFHVVLKDVVLAVMSEEIATAFAEFIQEEENFNYD